MSYDRHSEATQGWIHEEIGVQRQAAWTRWQGPLALSLAAAIWGGMYVVSAAVLQVIPPWVLLEMRFVLGLLCLGALALRFRAWHVDRRDLPLLLLLGLVGYTGSIGLQFIGTALSGAAMGSLITSASPGLIALFAWPLLREQLTARRALAVALATTGVLVVIGRPGATATGQGNGGFIGDLALAGAAITWAFYTVLSRRQTRRNSSLTVTTWATLFGVLFTLPIAAWQWQADAVHLPVNPALWLGVVYLGVVATAGAFFLWNKGFETVNAATGSLFLFFQPLVGGVLGVLLLGERLGWNFALGAGLIAASVYVAARSEWKQGQ
jgi:drug/metabolite transporter (DMT)-like permease